MATTTTTEETYTRCGITATAEQWSGAEFRVSDGRVCGDNPHYRSDTETAHLLMARAVTGHDDWRALGWLIQWRADGARETTRSTAMARLADALSSIAASPVMRDARIAVHLNDRVTAALERLGR